MSVGDNDVPPCAAPAVEPVPAALPVGERFDALLVSVDNDPPPCAAPGVEPVPATLPVRERFDALSVFAAPGVEPLPATLPVGERFDALSMFVGKATVLASLLVLAPPVLSCDPTFVPAPKLPPYACA